MKTLYLLAGGFVLGVSVEYMITRKVINECHEYYKEQLKEVEKMLNRLDEMEKEIIKNAEKVFEEWLKKSNEIILFAFKSSPLIEQLSDIF